MSRNSAYRRAAEKAGLNPGSVWMRIRRGATLKEAVSKPMRQSDMGVTSRARVAGINPSTIYKRRSRYGMTVDEAFSVPKDGRCQSCREEAKLHADHDHATGKFRGWLCQPCNLGLGAFRDSPELMRNAMAYLMRTNV